MKISTYVKSFRILLLVFILSSYHSFAQDENTSGSDGLSVEAAVVSKGEQLFSGNCTQCHAVHEQVVGPKLAGVYERQSVEWLISFIKYPQKVIESGDEYAVALYEKYKQYMPNHDFLSDEEIKSILSYVKAKTIEGPPPAENVASNDSGTTGGGQQSGFNTNLLLTIIGLLIALLIIVMIAMILMISVLSKFIRKQGDLSEEDQEYLNQKFKFSTLLRSQTFVTVVALVFITFAAKATVDGLFSIGVQQGYAPDQPIKFSHKLHAGFYEIDCKYCHTSVEKSKNANIPSANICMNCHNTIKTTSPEIQKIYTALENDEPIQWVRVHNLPDLSYFNHSQHVKVAGLECETCHGEITEMEVVQQHSLLTMGWCIDCHRKTEVNVKNNEYYSRLLEAHQGNDPMVVEDIGGLECSKCHY